MPERQTAAPAAPGPPAAGREEQSTLKKFISIAQQMFLMWAITNLATKYFTSSSTKEPAAPVAVTKPGESTPASVDARLLPPAQAIPAWNLGQQLDMHVHLSTSPNGQVFSAPNWRKEQDKHLPNFVWANLTFGDWKAAYTAEFDINFPKSVLNNGSLWMDVFLTREGASPNPNDPTFNPENMHHVRKLLTPYLPRAKVRKEKKLLGNAENAEDDEPEEADYIVPHWHRNVTLALVSDSAKVPYGTLPPPIIEHIHLVPDQRDATGATGFYHPIIFPNEFWHLRDHYVELNSTTPTLPIQIVFQPMSYLKFQMFAAMTNGFKEAAKQQGGGAGAELDELKRMLIETNPWFLGLTGLVSLLHVLFEMLAFKSDVSHWRQKKEMVGVSIITNVFVQIIILLYLIDNNENTSWMILFGSGTGVLIEAWKVTKAVDISVVPAPPGSLIPYKLDIKDKHVLSEDEKKTQEYDKLAFRYVSYVAIPLLAAYTGYSLLYNTHRGWYSFVISTLTSFVYMFGFAQLVPQLIINYKLKSVAHMPMKAMIYKTLSTVVDDFFAFCIKMPFLHRLACFRDDVVFLIFLYQRWIYRIDPKRVNEYGQVMPEDTVAVKDGESKKDK
ncbi:cleft lip and palate associated transmembrane protein [Lyophyllum atratum]|nr:cleft lip and palate associated transmembrane protein [Lyophyllum atratum]